MNTRGFIYIAFGEKYVTEAIVSATSAKKYHPYPVTLITDAMPSAELNHIFDDIRYKKLAREFSDKLLMEESPYDETIFLDSDTLLIGSMDPVFLLLSNFDVALQFTDGGNHYSLPGLPPSFHEPSAGIIAWKKSHKTTYFFRLWTKWYADIEKSQGITGAWDQRSLRAALFFSDVRIAPLSNEYQFVIFVSNLVAGNVIMVHGRNITSRQIAELGRSCETRLWVPKVGICPIYVNAPILGTCRFLFRYTIRLCVVVGRRVLAAIGAWPYPESKRRA